MQTSWHDALYFQFLQHFISIHTYWSAGNYIVANSKGKGKGHPRTVHEGPEGELSYSSTLSLTQAVDGVGGQSHGQFTP